MNYLAILGALGAVGLWLLSYLRGAKVSQLEAEASKAQADSKLVPQEAAIDILKTSIEALDEQRKKDAKAYRDSLNSPGDGK